MGEVRQAGIAGADAKDTQLNRRRRFVKPAGSDSETVIEAGGRRLANTRLDSGFEWA